MNSPSVSVIVPNYNHARYLRKRIDSILAQTYQDFELILLDDCSTDESRDILRGYLPGPKPTKSRDFVAGLKPRASTDVKVEFNEVNSGSTFKQWNKGVRMAQGKYMWIAESDDYSDPRFLARLVSLLESDPRLAFAYCRSQCVSADDAMLGFADMYYFPDLDADAWTADFQMEGREACGRHFVRFNTTCNASAVVFRKSTWEHVGGADESLRLCGDWKLWAAMALEGNVAYVAEPLNYFRFHGASVRSQLQAAPRVGEHLDTARWILDRVPAPPKQVLRRTCVANASLWVPIVLDASVPRETKKDLLRRVRAYDPRPVRSALPFVFEWIRIKVLSPIWYKALDITYTPRHALRLTRDGFAQVKARLGLTR